MIHKVTFVLVIAFAGATYAALSCKDESGKNVDWFMAIKVPKMPAASGEPFTTGFSYAYITSNDATGAKTHWKLGKTLVKDPKSAFGRTLEPLYQNAKKYSHVMYNDAPPHGHGKESGYLAHAKGVLALDSTTGFWLIHSVPKFANPPSVGKYDYPDTGRDNGQTALCISIKTAAEAEDILKQLLYMRPNVYDVENSAGLKKYDQLFKDIAEKNWPKEPSSHIETITSQKGVNFESFSRNQHAAQSGELYSTFISPKLDTPLIVETWRRGAGGVLPSNCTKEKHFAHDIMNVAEMQLELTGSEQKTTGTWPYLKDHSKWAISADSNKPFVCIGDINRMSSQLKRGGGTVCVKSKPVWSMFRDSVAALEPCERHG